MVKTTIKVCKRFFFHKINNNMQRKVEIKCFARSLVDVTGTKAGFKAL